MCSFSAQGLCSTEHSSSFNVLNVLGSSCTVTANFLFVYKGSCHNILFCFDLQVYCIKVEVDDNTFMVFRR